MRGVLVNAARAVSAIASFVNFVRNHRPVDGVRGDVAGFRSHDSCLTTHARARPVICAWHNARVLPVHVARRTHRDIARVEDRDSEREDTQRNLLLCLESDRARL